MNQYLKICTANIKIILSDQTWCHTKFGQIKLSSKHGSSGLYLVTVTRLMQPLDVANTYGYSDAERNLLAYFLVEFINWQPVEAAACSPHLISIALDK